jgi:hypothetical protein
LQGVEVDKRATGLEVLTLLEVGFNCITGKGLLGVYYNYALQDKQVEERERKKEGQRLN